MVIDDVEPKKILAFFFFAALFFAGIFASLGRGKVR
jgi:hypothetical protein